MSERIIYDATENELLGFLSQIERLREEGKGVGSLEKEIWDRLEELIEKNGRRVLSGDENEQKIKNGKNNY